MMKVPPDTTDISQAYAALLMNHLASSDWRVRDGVAAELREADVDGVTSHLVELLGSENVGERNAAITALIKRGEDSLPALHRALENPDPDVRNFVALSLGHIAAEESAGVLLQAFGVEDDANVQYHIVEALGRIGSSSSATFLVGLFREAEPTLAAAAIQACGTMRAVEATQPLLSLLDDPVLGLVAIKALGEIGSPRAIAPLVRLADAPETSATVRSVAAGAVAGIVARIISCNPEIVQLIGTQIEVCSESPLVEAVRHALGSPEAEPKWVLLACWLALPSLAPVVLRHAVDPTLVTEIAQFVQAAEGERLVENAAGSTDPVLRLAAARLVAHAPQLGGTGVDALLRDNEPTVRAAAMRAAASIQGPRAVPVLAEALCDDEPRVGFAALEELNDLVRPDDASLLVALSRDDRADVRSAAIRLLGRLPGESLDQSAVKELAGDPEPSVRAALARFLSVQRRSRWWDTVAGLAADESPLVRAAAAGAVVRFRHPDVPELLASLLTDSEAVVRAATADALEQSPGDRPKSLLPGLLGDEDPRVVIAALGALGRSGLWNAAAAVAECLRSENGDIRTAALRALDNLEHHAAFDAALALAVKDDSWNVRLAALETLRGEREEDVRQVLLRALDDPCAEVRGAAIDALPGVMGPLTANHAARFLVHHTLHAKATAALCRGGDTSVDAIERLLTSAPLAAAGPATRVLSLIDGPHAIALLERLLWHHQAAVRWWTAASLTMVPHPELAEAIDEAAGAEEDADIRVMLESARSAAHRAAGG